jgi:valyl-tRNA synthetase
LGNDVINRRVVVTGIGTVSPLGNTTEETWAGLVAGRSGVDYITRFDTSGHTVRFAAETKGFEPTRFVEKKELKKMDYFIFYAIAASLEALAAGIEAATRRQYPEGIAAYGTDALRFTFASLATHSRDIRFDMQRVAGYRNFCNKLWNAARFLMMTIEQSATLSHDGAVEYSAADRWIRSRLGAAIRTVDEAFADYRFDFAAAALYDFTWHEYCDWYLEFVKPIMQGTGVAVALQRGARSTLLAVLEALLRALHPLMPFITEEIWQRVAPLVPGAHTTASIMVAPWPLASAFAADAAAEHEIGWLMRVVLGVRQIRGEMDISPARRLPLLLHNAGAEDIELAQRHQALLMRLAGVNAPQGLAPGTAPPPAAAAIVGELTLLVPMAGLIDPAAEHARLTKKIEKTRQEIARAKAKLGNDSFVRGAPAAVVAQERERLAAFEQSLTGLERQLVQVRALQS